MKRLSRYLGDVITQLTSPTHNIQIALRKCQLVCELLNFEPQKLWFQQELGGYHLDSPLPAYRTVSGTSIWEIVGSDFDRIQWMSEKAVFGVDPVEYCEEETDLKYELELTG